MNVALAGQIIGFLIQYGPAGIDAVNQIIQGVKKLTADGTRTPTDEELQQLADRIVAQHAALPKPE